jgi:hypothetical protein
LVDDLPFRSLFDLYPSSPPFSVALGQRFSSLASVIDREK